MSSLVAVRWGRMLASPFAFLRGSAAVMAHDLAATPATGLMVQACGDAHIANFGVFASPERNLLFDVNDFDETFPGPWEWDLKRLATSAVVAARTSGLNKTTASDAACGAVREYREHMTEYAQMGILDVWYSRVDPEAAMRTLGASTGAAAPVRSAVTAAEHHTSATALPHLTSESEGGRRRIVDHPPLVTHEYCAEHADTLETIMHSYRGTLEDDRRALLDHFEVDDFALKVVGVGSVGTRCFIGLLSSDAGDPLFLQVKQADRSALDGLVPRSSVTERVRPGRDEQPRRAAPAGSGQPEGRRVVDGQRLMQSGSDIFLGWASAGGFDYYVRQLWDMKGTVDLSTVSASAFIDYVELCGWSLALAHARSGQAAAIAGYAGSGDTLDQAIVSFAGAYADQTERDHSVLVEAVRKGWVVATTGV